MNSYANNMDHLEKIGQISRNIHPTKTESRINSQFEYIYH